MSTSTQYSNLKITGPLNIVPINPQDCREKDVVLIILLGPVGSGKSAFIESLAPDQQLPISGDSLDAVTQKVSLYTVINLEHTNLPVIIMDTPGLLDRMQPESRVLRMTTQMVEDLRESARSVVVSIFYFHPITDTRLSMSKRYAMQIFMAYVEMMGMTKIILVSTMWNHCFLPAQTEDANRHLNSLVHLFSPPDDTGVTMEFTQFQESKESALTSIDKIFPERWHGRREVQGLNTPFRSMVNHNLLDRIAAAKQQLQILVEDKLISLTPGEDPRLLPLVHRDTQEVMLALQSYYGEFYLLDPEQCRSLLQVAPSSSLPSWDVTPPFKR